MKKFIKNNLKIILVAGATAIICISGSVFATLQYQASQVEYKDGKSVEIALNELYAREITKSSSFVANDTTTTNNIFLGFRPSKVVILAKDLPHNGNTIFTEILYTPELYSNKIIYTWRNTNGTSGSSLQDLSLYDFSVNDNGFTYKAVKVGTHYYYAIK